jgi:hypothetical protein
LTSHRGVNSPERTRLPQNAQQRATRGTARVALRFLHTVAARPWNQNRADHHHRDESEEDDATPQHRPTLLAVAPDRANLTTPRARTRTIVRTSFPEGRTTRMSRLIRLDATGHSTLAEWTAADDAAFDVAVREFDDGLDQGYIGVLDQGEGHAEQVRELPRDAGLVIMRRPIAGG